MWGFCPSVTFEELTWMWPEMFHFMQWIVHETRDETGGVGMWSQNNLKSNELTYLALFRNTQMRRNMIDFGYVADVDDWTVGNILGHYE